MAEKKAVVAKGNKTTEIIIGAAAQKLSTAVISVLAAIETVKGLEAKAADGILQVGNLEDKISLLTQELENRKSQHKFDLELSYKSNKEAFVNTWLSENGKDAIHTEELRQLKADLAEAKNDVETKIAKEVGKVIGIEKNNSANAMRIAGLEWEKKEAANAAEINQLKSQNKFLEDQVTLWKGALDAERNAGIERAKHSAINTLNVGSNQSGR